jgi:hypothetical protein
MKVIISCSYRQLPVLIKRNTSLKSSISKLNGDVFGGHIVALLIFVGVGPETGVPITTKETSILSVLSS